MRFIGLLAVGLLWAAPAFAQDQMQATKKVWGLAGGASSLSIAPGQCTGLMVMAHGGSEEWDSKIHGLVSGLRAERPVAVALGMANPATMAVAVDSLLAVSVDEILVVRVFMSSQSFLGATRFVLGLQDEKPAYSMYADQMVQLEIPVPVTVGGEGLMDAPEVGAILRSRAQALRVDQAKESVLLLAHGAGREEENQAWLASMNAQADSIRASDSFAIVAVETLREDWDEARKAAELRIRSFVSTEAEAGRTVIVIPFRVSGFGPYAEVLEGLSYRSDGLGLLPDVRISDWIGRQLADHGAANSCREIGQGQE